MTPSARPRLDWRLRWTLGAAAIVALSFGAKYTIDAVRAPWLGSFGLMPTLVGEWHGTMTGPDGRRMPVYLDLDGYVAKSSNIGGRGRICDGARIDDYTLYGRPDTWRGDRFRFEWHAVVERGSGTKPNVTSAEWDGDTIRATSALVRLGSTASVSESRASVSESGVPPSSNGPAATYELRRGGERDFEEACKRR